MTGSCALTVDGVLLPLHGAAAAEHIGDPEGDLIGAVRALMGSGALVVTDGDPERAAHLATGLAKEYWRRSAELEPEVRTPEQAVAAGLQAEGTVLMVETADRCGGGAAGDSAASLKALLGAALPGPALVPVVDPAAAKFIVAKNPMNYNLAYSPNAATTYILDTPGPPRPPYATSPSATRSARGSKPTPTSPTSTPPSSRSPTGVDAPTRSSYSPLTTFE